MAKRKQRVYTLRDLEAIAKQLGGRLRIDIVPAELFEPKPEPSPESDK